MDPGLHLNVVGVLLLALAAAHILFPRRLRWSEELSRLSLLNRQIFIVHCLFIILILVMMGVLSLCFGDALLEPGPLGRAVAGGLTLFWTLRLATQWLIYDPALWRGNRFNTGVHVVFSLTWAYFAAVYGCVFWTQCAS